MHSKNNNNKNKNKNNNNSNNELPPGYRSDLMNAINIDDPEAVAHNLEVCSQVERSALLGKQAGKLPFESNDWREGVWNNAEAQNSRLKNMDNSFCIQLNTTNKSEKPASLQSLVFAVAAKFNCVRVTLMLMSDKYASDVNPTVNNNYAFRKACLRGHYEIVKLLMSDTRIDPSTCSKSVFILASRGNHCDVMKLLMTDDRVDPSVSEQAAMKYALEYGNIDMMRLLLSDDRVEIANERLLLDFACKKDRVDSLFEAFGPVLWPRVIRNNFECLPRKNGHFREKLDEIESESSWQLLLCVKRHFSEIVAARVGEMLREVCTEWTRYVTVEFPFYKYESLKNEDMRHWFYLQQEAELIRKYCHVP